ncbi:hypothetical protein FNH22_18815 [Fulvivirga sp. M361]|uniref:hypothetical protein n=1 Tax=Fulvivirga sp. M361 TaxID=2594266 RepID=UPI00117A64AA|nr:hypothetical protein [Fulvivirga sp. M361]TRX54807.1 hypothetical protein FNH22_18815 [Fulvivirga sp. M361]
MLLRKKITLFLLLSIFFHYSLYSQIELNYSGPYKVAEYQGNADFGYKLLAGDTTFHGPFRMQHSDLQDLLSKQDPFFSFEGTFQNNLPEGPWSFKFGEFTADASDGLEVVDYHYRVKTNGIHHEASGDIFEGLPDGRWTHTIQQIKSSQVEETLFKSTIDFDKGVPQKSFQIQNERMTLMGRFLRDGLAHDVWELYSTEGPGAIESWYFSDGKLDKILLKNNDSTLIVKVYDTTLENPKVINLDDRYLNIVKLNQRLTTDNEIKIKGEVTHLLAENAGYYQKIDNILSKLGDARFMPEFKVKANHNPLKNNELIQLNAIKTLYRKSEKISNKLVKSTYLNILKLSDDEALFLLSVIDKISKKHLSFLKEVTRFYDQRILSFVPREHILSKLWPEGRPSTEIIIINEQADDTRTRSYTGPDADSYQFEKDGIEGIHELATYVSNCLESIQSRLNEKLTKEQWEKQLVVLEAELISEITTLNRMADSLRQETAGELQNALNTIKKVAKQELSAYSAMEDMTEKPDLARLLTNCFDQMQELALTVSRNEVRMEEIKTAYTDEVWNPFTATVMSEEVKKRITEAYEDVLIPHMLNQLSDSLSCSNIPHLILLMENTHQRMLELREENTDKLERKLKRERDPMTILQLFNIQTDRKEVGP